MNLKKDLKPISLPTTSLGSEYYVVTYCETAGQFCYLQIVTLDIGTTAEVVLANGGSSGVAVEFLGVTYYGGDTISITLNQYQVVHLESTGDLTGTRISANANIVVYSGSSATTIQGVGDGFLLKPMPPVSTWGKEYVAVRTPGRIATGDYFRIITCEANTIVTISGESPIILPNKGQWVQRNFSGSDVRILSSNKPVMVVRLSPGQREVTEPGLPTMVVLVPNEQFMTETNVVVPKVSGLTNNTVTVVTKEQYTSNVIVESSPVTNWATVGNSNYMVADVPVTSDFITISSVPEARFAVYFHGHGSLSLAYSVGRILANINPNRSTMGAILHLVFLLLLLRLGATSSVGKEFVLIYPEMKGYNGSLSLSTYVVGPGSMTLTVYESGSAGTTTLLMMNGEILLGNTNIIYGSDTSFSMVRLTSDKNVNIFGRYTGNDRGELYQTLPTTSLGSEYYVVTYCETAGQFCYLQIVTLDIGTTAEVVLANGGSSGVAVEFLGVTYYGGDTISITLNQYQVVHLESTGDLTGTRISANANIVVYSGSSATTIQGVGDGFLLKPMPPVSTWGKEYVAVRTPGRIATGDYFRIITCEANTIVTISGESPIILPNKGQWVQRNFSGSDVRILSSNKPVMVVRLSPGQREVTEPGLPTMVVLVPNEQFMTETNVVVPKVSGLTNNTVTVVTKEQYTSNVIVESSPVTNWATVGNSNYMVADVPVTSDFITISSVPEARFAVYFHGHGSLSLAYSVGRILANINPQCTPTVMSIGDEVDNDCDGQADEDSCTLTDYAGKDCSVIVSDERDVHGTKFVFVFPYHTPDPALTVAVYFSQPSVVVTLQTPNLPGQYNITQTLSGSTRSFDVPYSLQVNESSASNNTMLLEASEEVSLMILSADPSPEYSEGAFRVLPTDGLGREYIAVTYCEDNMCFIDICAVHPDTAVTVRLKLVNVSHAITYGGVVYRHGDTIVIGLALYESAQVLSAVDMTGTKITASKPVAIITGGQFTKVMGLSNKDMVVEQLMPLQALGQSVAVVQTPGRLTLCSSCRDYIRLIATQDDTLVTLDMDGASTPYAFTFEGMFQDIQLIDKGTIKSDKPIMVIQFMVTHSYRMDGGMVLVVPVEQYSNGDHLFIPSTNLNIVHILVITNQSDTSKVTYNENAFTSWENLPGTMMLATSSAEFVRGDTYNITGSTNSTIGGHIGTRMSIFAPGTFSFPLAYRLEAINQPCVVTQSLPGDSIDNDCDGLVDEENCTVGISEDGDYDGMFDEDCKEAAVASSSIMPTSVIAGASVDLSVTSLEEYSSRLVIQSTSEDIITSTFMNPSASSVDHLVSSASSADIATSIVMNPSASSVDHLVTPISTEGIATSILMNPSASSVHQLITPISTESIATSTLKNPSVSSEEHFVLSAFTDPPTSSVDIMPPISSLGSSPSESPVSPNSSSVEVSMLTSSSTFLPYASAQLETSSILHWSTETPEPSHAAVVSSTPVISQSQQTIEERCTCKCSPWKTDIASESLTQVVESIKKELTVDKDTVSQAIRKKTSAPDHRQSAVSMGYVGIAVISSLFVGIFVLDAGSLYRDLLSLFKTLKDNCKSKQAM